jgi:hypothetical protein
MSTAESAERPVMMRPIVYKFRAKLRFVRRWIRHAFRERALTPGQKHMLFDEAYLEDDSFLGL